MFEAELLRKPLHQTTLTTRRFVAPIWKPKIHPVPSACVSQYLLEKTHPVQLQTPRLITHYHLRNFDLSVWDSSNACAQQNVSAQRFPKQAAFVIALPIHITNPTTWVETLLATFSTLLATFSTLLPTVVLFAPKLSITPLQKLSLTVWSCPGMRSTSFPAALQTLSTLW